MNWTPALSHASLSVGVIGRDASAMSISSRQNFWKPPPVPEMPDGDARPAIGFLELFGHRLGDGKHRARSVDRDHLGRLVAVCRLVLASTAARGGRQ